MKAFIVFLALLALASASRPVRRAPFGGRIIGGEDAGDTEFPYQVDLQAYGESFCSGAIYDDLRIITLAQCALAFDGFTDRLVIAGVTDIKNLRGNEQNRSIASYEFHENYVDGIYDFDIAILTLNEPLMFNQRVQPIRLAIPTIEASGEGISTGWGSTIADGLDPVSKLQKVTMNITDKDFCVNNYSALIPITSNMLCASARGKGACVGDQGSPLSVKDGANRPYLAGLFSFATFPCADVNYPSVYTNIASVRGWLESKLNP